MDFSAYGLRASALSFSLSPFRSYYSELLTPHSLLLELGLRFNV